eukprot:GCRY01001769.1.p1 GENE.GCRY01001769.1~~GCRY01001769.1.p1  ORF type:complete len:319 (-),score=43.55 GCRY01001769.1:175-1131(-)
MARCLINYVVCLLSLLRFAFASVNIMAEKQPVLFISHGSPTIIQDNSTLSKYLMKLPTTEHLESPVAVCYISAHYHTSAPNSVEISTGEMEQVIYDFYGFPKEMYSYTYNAPSAVPQSKLVAEELKSKGFNVVHNPKQSLDHGAWIPAKLMYPLENTPVFHISVNLREGEDFHFRVGQALAPLREKSILFIASGGSTHNLSLLDWHSPDSNRVASWVGEWEDWLKQEIEAGQVSSLLQYRTKGPHNARAQPASPGNDHFLPLFVALGLVAGMPSADDGASQVGQSKADLMQLHAKGGHRIFTDTTYGTLSTSCYIWRE